LSVGSKHGVAPRDVIGLINQAFRQERVTIGQIEIMKSFSFFEVEEEFAQDVAKSFKGTKFKEFDLEVEAAKPRAGGSSGGRSYKREDSRSSDKPRGDRRSGGSKFGSKSSSSPSGDRKRKGKNRKPF
jgi:ATP-dependent RNA helicase DeaD